MNRRNFLTALTGLAATLTLDLEKLLWRPGEKTIFIPGISDDGMGLKIGDIVVMEMRFGRFDGIYDEPFIRRYLKEAGERAGRRVSRIITAEFTN